MAHRPPPEVEDSGSARRRSCAVLHFISQWRKAVPPRIPPDYVRVERGELVIVVLLLCAAMHRLRESQEQQCRRVQCDDRPLYIRNCHHTDVYTAPTKFRRLVATCGQSKKVGPSP